MSRSCSIILCAKKWSARDRAKRELFRASGQSRCRSFRLLHSWLAKTSTIKRRAPLVRSKNLTEDGAWALEININREDPPKVNGCHGRGRQWGSLSGFAAGFPTVSGL
jgi:hypothetical protein